MWGKDARLFGPAFHYNGLIPPSPVDLPEVFARHSEKTINNAIKWGILISGDPGLPAGGGQRIADRCPARRSRHPAVETAAKSNEEKRIYPLWQKFHRLILARGQDREMFLALSAGPVPRFFVICFWHIADNRVLF